jgi:hypothetical protein
MKALSVIHFLTTGDVALKVPMHAQALAQMLLPQNASYVAEVERITDSGHVRKAYVRVGAIAWIESLE